MHHPPHKSNQKKNTIKLAIDVLAIPKVILFNLFTSDIFGSPKLTSFPEMAASQGSHN